MATHSSILAWEIPWTEKPDRLHSLGSQRVGHDSALMQDAKMQDDKEVTQVILLIMGLIIMK